MIDDGPARSGCLPSQSGLGAGRWQCDASEWPDRPSPGAPGSLAKSGSSQTEIRSVLGHCAWAFAVHWWRAAL